MKFETIPFHDPPESVNFLMPCLLDPMFMRDPPTFPVNFDNDPFFLLLKSATDPPTVSLGN